MIILRLTLTTTITLTKLTDLLSITKKQQQITNLKNNSRNNHSKMAQYRRIRGANAECCRRACHIEELRPYCKP